MSNPDPATVKARVEMFVEMMKRTYPEIKKEENENGKQD